MVEQVAGAVRSGLSSSRLTIMDVGLGILYFFTSHMVIRAMFYIGLDRTPGQLSVFFLITITSIVAAHLLYRPLLRLRAACESNLDLPAVSVIATLGVAIALLSMLPVAHISFFYTAAAFLGISCGWMSVIWASTINSRHVDAETFRIDPALLVAVLFYFLFRLISTFSDAAAQGFLLALPLATIACILQASRTKANMSHDEGGQTHPLLVLVVVAAAFAIAGGLALDVSGHEGVVVESGLNLMVLLEVCAVALIAFCCSLMRRLLTERKNLSSIGTIGTFAVTYAPMFLIGTVMGDMGIPFNTPNALWESNIWVLLIAIFAYDIRSSLYAVRGLAVGLMFEAMCMGQLVIRATKADAFPAIEIIALALMASYFIGIAMQFFHPMHRHKRIGHASHLKENESASSPINDSGAQTTSEPRPAMMEVATPNAQCASRLPSLPESFDGASQKTLPDKCETENAPHQILDSHIDESSITEQERFEVIQAAISAELVPTMNATCRKLADDFGLTEREAEILGLVASGRSAKFIAEELSISYNTARTHIKHVYEKLNIHSKQELIDLVLYSQ